MAVTGWALLAAATAEAPVNQFSTGDGSQGLIDLLASAVDGLIFLPFALLFVWCIQALNLNRWIFATAAMATILALASSVLTHEFVVPIFSYGEQILEMLGLHRFMYRASPAILLCFSGALALAWFYKRRTRIGVHK